MNHFTYLVIFHLKVTVRQNVNLPHTYGSPPPKTPICDMILIKIFTRFTKLFKSYRIIMFNRYYKFHKD